MLQGFEFAADGRTFVCTTEERRGVSGEFWWWFSVSGDASSYAPFPVKSSDTRQSVQDGVLQFYRHRCERLAERNVRGGQWGRKPLQVGKAAPQATQTAAEQVQVEAAPVVQVTSVKTPPVKTTVVKSVAAKARAVPARKPTAKAKPALKGRSKPRS